MANTSTVALGTKPALVLSYHIYTSAHMCALYEVAKHMLLDEVCLFVFVGGLCCRRIVLAHVAKHVRGLHIQFFNQFFVILQSTRRIFEEMLWNKKFLTTDHHL